jgi:hypothetical protein
MKYADYDKMVYNENDMVRYKALFEKDILDKATELSKFLDRANERIKWIKECEANKKYSILGSTQKSGKDKSILLIIRYEDGSQRDERYNYSKITELREKLTELREKHNGVDWSKFREEI